MDHFKPSKRYKIYSSKNLEISVIDHEIDFEESRLQLCDPLNERDKNQYSRSLTNEEWLDTEAAAEYLKISVGSLRNMTSNGLIPYNKLGRRNRYRTEDLRQLLLSNKRGALHGN